MPPDTANRRMLAEMESAGEQEFAEATTCGAGNSVSFATGSAEVHEALRLTAQGVWRLRRWSDLSGPAGEDEVSLARAREWLLQNQHDEALDRYFPSG